ncbi:unnamed protein product, partial [Ectocarpus sp. 6 AP-2014]
MVSPSPASLGDHGSSLHNSWSSSQPGQIADVDVFTLKCETGFFVVGLQPWEAAWTSNAMLCTLITMTVTSAWISRRKSIKKLIIFFGHWL